MVKNLCILLLTLFLFSRLAEARQDIVIVQSVQIPPYEEAIKGFQEKIQSEIIRLVLSELHKNDVFKKINEINPDLILAIGHDALSTVKRLKKIPIIYIMVLYPQSILTEETNVIGISMNISQERQLFILTRALPTIKNIGIVYDPDKTGHYVNRAQKAADKFNVNIIAKDVHSAGDVPSALDSMRGKIDLFWMFPDTSVITDETVESMLLFSIENMTPVLAFSEKYLELGAFVSIGIDPFDIGRQAGEIAHRILSKENNENLTEIEARKEVIFINLKIARKLGIKLDEETISKAKIID